MTLAAGILSMTIDGTSYEVVGSVNYGLSSVERELLKSISGITGKYKETPVPGYIEAQLRDDAAISVSTFRSMTNSSIQLGVANGKTITGTGMVNVKAVEVDPIEAVFSVRFEGRSVAEA